MIKKICIKTGALSPIHTNDNNNENTTILPIQYDGKIVRILLTDTSLNIVTGSGHKYTVQEHLNKYNEVDIVIDAKKPLIEKIVWWAKSSYEILKKQKPGVAPIIVFNTNNQEYYTTIKLVLESNGWNVIDQSKRDDEIYLELVYQDSTADTVNSNYLYFSSFPFLLTFFLNLKSY